MQALRVAVIAAYIGALASARGQTTSATTKPVGFTATSCLANFDTYLSVPFTLPPEFTGSVQSISGSTLTITGSPGWSRHSIPGVDALGTLISVWQEMEEEVGVNETLASDARKTVSGVQYGTEQRWNASGRVHVRQ
jgi:hypothetical protein